MNCVYDFNNRLEKLGSLDWYRVVEKHQAWRLLTCIWLHAGVIHLAINMLSIVFMGTRLEQQFGFGMLCYFIFLSTTHLTRASFGQRSRFSEFNYRSWNFWGSVFPVRIGVIYIMSGMGGSILSSLFIRNDISVGASGALFGLLGSMLSELLTNWTIYSNKVYLSIIRALYKLILLDPLGIVRPFFFCFFCVWWTS